MTSTEHDIDETVSDDSTVADSTAADSTAADSTAADSTAADSTAADSTAADSTAAETTADGTAARPSATSRARRIGGAARPVARSAQPAGAESDAGADRRKHHAPNAPSPGPRPVSPQDVTRRRGPARRWLPAGLAALALAAVIAAGAVLAPGWLHDSTGGTDAKDREALLAAVKAGTQLVISYDYRHIDQDASAAEAHLTGQFKTQYATSVATAVKAPAIKDKVVVVGSVTRAGVVSMSKAQATVVVFGQQQVTSSANTAPRLDFVSVLVTADRTAQGWLISKIDRD